ncbi:MAG: Gfo/Idh/MocA family oxidoreductase [Fibrobacterales bacterium]
MTGMVETLSSSHRKKIVIIGLGAMGSKHVDAVFRGTCFSLSALVDKDSTTWREDLPCYLSLSEALEEHHFDGAIVAASCDSHYPLVRQLLKQRIPVLVEKPFVLEQSDAEILMAYDDAIPLMVGHSERFNPAWKKTCELLGQLGELIAIESYRALPTMRSHSDRDVLYDLMIHDLDLIFSKLGCGVTTLECQGDERAFRDCCSVTMTIGDVAILCRADRVSGRSERSIKIEGALGYMECDLLNRAVTVSLHDGPHQKVSVVESDPLEDEHTAFDTMIDSGQSDSNALQCATEAVSVCQQVHTLFTTQSIATLV